MRPISKQLRTRIEQACLQRASPASGDVSLLAVSKTFACPVGGARFACGAAGVWRKLYAGSGGEKCQAGPPGPATSWHCIGPIQGNKTRLVAEHFDWLHTLDRLKIARRLNAQRPVHLAPLQVCIQVNVDGGANKAGVAPSEALALARVVAALPGLQLRGVMSIPEPAPDFESQRALHLKARAVFEEIRAAGLPGAERFDTLSLGMSNDLEAAVAAGSTMVRVGSALFGQRPVLAR
ncbi:MAG: YggS family pyridoxal phosphate-dependent enzyme [Simplicispira sp.]|nr:YggS family pyridoxal phosphate-dependent enzyme [Simplicispira sp.]